MNVTQGSVRSILSNVVWTPEQAHEMGQASKLLKENSKYISDPLVWLEIWKKYLPLFNNLLSKKATRVKSLKDKQSEYTNRGNISDPNLQKISFALLKETNELLILNGAKIFMDNAQFSLSKFTQNDSKDLSTIKKENILLFSLAEQFEKLYKSSSEQEKTITEISIKVLEENAKLKQQIKSLKSL